MTRADELVEIMTAVRAGGYEEGELALFRAEYGWADWMSAYTAAADDEEISEAESREIDAILEEGFRMAFDPISRRVYGVE